MIKEYTLQNDPELLQKLLTLRSDVRGIQRKYLEIPDLILLTDDFPKIEQMCDDIIKILNYNGSVTINYNCKFTNLLLQLL